MKTIEIARTVERVAPPHASAHQLLSGTPVPLGRIGAFVLTALFSASAAGCDFNADRLKRDEAIASLKLLRQEQDSGPGPIRLRVFANAPGRDNRNPNGEYVTLFNSSAEVTDIGGWSLCKGASYCFTFPHRASIPANGSVRVYSGSGQTTATSFYMGSGRGVWHNDHDSATLRNGETVVARDTY